MEKKDNYHHGDLKVALIEEGLKQLETIGIDELSLRGLAKAVGVSANAPYRHFKDKKDLMTSFAAFGFTKFANAIVDANQGEPLVALKLEGAAYINFAINNKAVYKLMFSPYGYTLHSETCQKAAARSFGCLIETTHRAQMQGYKSHIALNDVVLAFWSALHGFAILLIDDLIPKDIVKPDIASWLDTVLGV